MKIGFIGQGFIGGNMATDFEERGYETVRYGLQPEYVGNKDLIAECDYTFIAVPTPTTPEGFDLSIVNEALRLIGKGKTAVIKSTILPGSTEDLQYYNPDIFVLHSPEFLREKSALFDCKHPERNIIGVPVQHERYIAKASEVMKILPGAKYERIMMSKESELIKYMGNSFLTVKVIYANMMADLAESIDCDWDTIKDAVGADSRIGHSHLDVDLNGERGAGGHCFIKDFQALYEFMMDHSNDNSAIAVMENLVDKNIELLANSGKDHDLLKGVYGDNIVNAHTYSKGYKYKK